MVVYVGGSPVKVVAGVEVLSPLEPTDTVQPFSTPAGEVVTTVHWGEYSQMHGAYTALEAWCAANRRQPSGISWEVYGDAADEPADRRTDIYLLLR